MALICKNSVVLPVPRLSDIGFSGIGKTRIYFCFLFFFKENSKRRSFSSFFERILHPPCIIDPFDSSPPKINFQPYTQPLSGSPFTSRTSLCRPPQVLSSSLLPHVSISSHLLCHIALTDRYIVTKLMGLLTVTEPSRGE